jgi:methylphosphotriester-DNA--protein-cysteine methyltransferase
MAASPNSSNKEPGKPFNSSSTWCDCQSAVLNGSQINVLTGMAQIVIGTLNFDIAFFRARLSYITSRILRRKIDAACVQLRGGRDSVTDVAFALGFSSSQYFASVFRRFMGCTPVSHRRR